MKKLLFLLSLTTGLFFASCSKEDVISTLTIDTDSTTSLLADEDFVGSASELQASARGGGNGPGDFKGKKMKEIAVDSLSDVIKTFIDATYAGATVDKAFQDKNGNVIVLITKADGTKVGLLFDKSGAFQKEVTKKKGNDPKKDLTSVDVATLSATITDYVKANYAGATISKAYTDADGNFYIVVTKADGTKTGVLFDKNGVFVKELPKHGKGALTTLDVATLSAAIKDYVATNYVGSTIIKAYNDPSANILVTVKTADGGTVRLLFDAKGTFVKVLKKK